MTLLRRPLQRTILLSATLLYGCASISSDRFYALQPIPATPANAHGVFTTQVSLQISVPSMVDRNEMVVKQADRVKVLEHERWAAPLTDQILIVLGQDLENRRADLLISTRRISQVGAPRFNVAVEIFDLALASTGGARIEVRWRVSGMEIPVNLVGRDTFTASGAGGAGYGAGAEALSQCIALLAERIVADLPKP